jgi:serine/threonine protein kinase
MASITLTVEKYCKLLNKSKLLAEEDIKAAYSRWKEATRGSSDDDAEAIRKFLVAQRLLTEYQSMLLMRGHSDGFFLDQNRILDLIGKGRMAGVYKALDPNGQIVAIKVLPPSKAKDNVILSRFLRESKLLTKLDHPNVVRAIYSGESAGRHYLVMEHLEGETLEDVLGRRKRLPPAEAVRIVYQTLLGLQHVFEQGMIHRDLKPANIMLIPMGPAQGDTTLNCAVKILDIGLGRTVFDENAKEPDDASVLTGEGVLLGTPDYLAPEQARSAREADIRSDIYSMGCVLFHLLTGQQPFPDTNILTQIVRHATESSRPLSDFINPVPDGLQQVLNWMMAKDPNQRYPTPARAAQALQMFLPNPEGSASHRPVQAASPQMKAVPPVPLPNMPEIPTGRLESGRREKSKDSRKTSPVAAPRPGAPVPGPVVENFGDDEFDVELVAVPPPAAAPMMPSPMRGRPADEERSLTDLDRRDFIMAGAGGGVVLFAILAGYGLSRLLKSSPPPDDASSEKEK